MQLHPPLPSHSLTILDCPRVTDRGLGFLTQLALLNSLALSGAKVRADRLPYD